MVFGKQNKFEFTIFGLITLLLRVMRRGWGTFVAQAGIPGIFPGHLSSPTDGYVVDVAWWQGYFWLFIVGIAWAGLPALILGGFMFSERKYTPKEILLYTILYFIFSWILSWPAKVLIPYLAPEAYYDVYIQLEQLRNYKSMVDNLSFALAIAPILIIIFFVKKDRIFVWNSIAIMIFFGIGLSIADIWQVLGRNNVIIGIPDWGLWEYFTGFIIGVLVMSFFMKRSPYQWEFANKYFHLVPIEETTNSFQKAGHYVLGHVCFIIYGITETITGIVSIILTTFGLTENLPIVMINGEELEIINLLIYILIFGIDALLYYFYQKNNRGNSWRALDFRLRCGLLLAGYIFLGYFAYMLRYIISGSLLPFITHADAWCDTISVFLIETMLLIGIGLAVSRRKVPLVKN
jgi:hypothetical protein